MPARFIPRPLLLKKPTVIEDEEDAVRNWIIEIKKRYPDITFEEVLPYFKNYFPRTDIDILARFYKTAPVEITPPEEEELITEELEPVTTIEPEKITTTLGEGFAAFIPPEIPAEIPTEELLPEGWRLDEDTGHLISPEGWRITEAGEWISPEGDRYSYDELLHIGDYFKLIEKQFAEEDIDDLFRWAESNPEGFIKTIREIGDSPDTRLILKLLYPSITEEEIETIFEAASESAALEVVPDTSQGGIITKIFGFFRDVDMLFAIPVCVAITRMEKELEPADEEFLKAIGEVYDKYGWRGLFTEEAEEAYNKWEAPVWGLKGTVELLNPIWLIPAIFTGGIGYGLKACSKLPWLYRISKGLEIAGTAVGEVAALPGKIVSLPIKAIGKRFIRKGAMKPIDIFEVTPPGRILPEKVPSYKELEVQMFQDDAFRKLGWKLANIPLLGSLVKNLFARGIAIERKIPERILYKTQIESAIYRGGILYRTRLEQFEAMAGVARAELAKIGSVEEILGSVMGYCNPKKVKPIFKDMDLTLGSVIQAPERYTFAHPRGFEYCKMAQRLCREIRELAESMGVDIKKTPLEWYEEYVHWKRIGAIAKERALKQGRYIEPSRISRAIGATPASLRRREYRNMMEGIEAGMRYEDDIEICVMEYIKDMGKVIADKEFSIYLKDMTHRIPMEGAYARLPITPKERVKFLYPDETATYEILQDTVAKWGYVTGQVKMLLKTKGETLPAQTLKAIERRLPDAHKDIVNALALSGKEKHKALREVYRNLSYMLQTHKQEYYTARRIYAQRLAECRLPQPGWNESYIKTASGLPHPAFGGQIYPREIADAVTNIINEKSNRILRTCADISGGFRLLKATLDLSASAIQLLIVSFAHPQVGIKAFAGAVKTFLNPNFYNKYVSLHRHAINDYLYHLGDFKTFEYFERLNAMLRVASKAPPVKGILRHTYGRAEAAFNVASLIYRVNMWEALAPIWKRMGQGGDLARFLARSSGLMSFNKIGMPKNTQDFLRGWVSFAPQYRLAMTSFFLDVFKGNLTGELARETFLKALSAGIVMYVGFCEAVGQKPYLNPFKDGKRFMSIHVNGHWIGLGGFFVSAMRAITDIAASAFSIGENRPVDFITLDKWRNPIIRAFLNQAAPLPGMLLEATQRADYLGYPLETPEDWALWAAEQVTPIWLSDVLYGKTDIPPSPLAMLGEFVGLRTSVRTRWETLDFALKDAKAYMAVPDITQEQIDRIEKEGETVLRVLNRFQQQYILENYPQFKDLYEEAMKDSIRRASKIRRDYEQVITNLRKALVERLEKHIMAVRTGEKELRWLREQVKIAFINYEGMRDGIRESGYYDALFAEWEEQRKRQEATAELFDLAYQEYMDKVILPDYETDAGEPDFARYNAEEKAWIEKWGVDFYEKVLYVLDKRGAEFYPEWVQIYWALKRELNKSGYWDVQKEKIQGVDFRKVFREKHPRIDAILAILGWVTALRSEKAVQIFQELAEQLGIDPAMTRVHLAKDKEWERLDQLMQASVLEEPQTFEESVLKELTWQK